MLSFAIAALLAVGSLASAQDPEAEIRFGAGVRLLRDGFPERALIEIEAALKKDPQNAFYLKGMSVAYSQLADKCRPDDSGCRNGHLKKAVEAAQKALVANPDYVDARNDLGIALLRLGKRTDGKAELAKAFADPQCPTPEVTAWNLGQAFFEEKEYNEAMTWFQAAQNKNKTLAASYVSIADILMILGPDRRGDPPARDRNEGSERQHGHPARPRRRLPQGRALPGRPSRLRAGHQERPRRPLRPPCDREVEGNSALGTTAKKSPNPRARNRLL